jgi:SAM-dependent methyltransferase
VISFLKCIANEARLGIISVLSHGDFSVMEIVTILSMGQSRISRHLKILQESGVVTSRRKGSWIIYALDDPPDERGKILALILDWARGEEAYRAIEDAVESALEQRRLRSRAYFSKDGSHWQLLKRRYIDEVQYYKILRKAIGERRVIADLGCGAGETIESLVKYHELVIGVDNSPEMLKSARRNLAEWTGKGVDLRLGDLEHLPLRDEEVDGVVASLVLHHLAKPADVFREFYRVLHPGGKVVVLEFEEHQDKAALESMGDLWFGFMQDDLEVWMTNAGFEEIRITRQKGGRGGMKLVLITGIKPV